MEKMQRNVLGKPMGPNIIVLPRKTKNTGKIKKSLIHEQKGRKAIK